MPSRSATYSIALRGSQPPDCSWVRHRIGITAEACRPSGYLAICCFAQARFSAVKAKLVGCCSGGARRRTDITGGLAQNNASAAWAHWSYSPVHLPEHDVERAEDGRNVGQQVAAANEVHRLEMGEARSTDFALVRLVGAVGDEVHAELALRCLDGGINLPGWHVVAFGVELEMMDQGLHRALHICALRRRDLVVRNVHEPLPFGRAQLLDALAHDADRLAHLLHADAVTIVAITAAADRDIEIELCIALIGLRLAQVPGSARASHHHAGETPCPGIGETDDADVDIALLEDAVVSEQRFKVIADLEEGIAERRDVVDQLIGQVLVYAADPEIGRMHAAARSALIKHHQLFALFEAPQWWRERSHVHRLRGDVEKVRQQTADLRIENANELRPFRDDDAEQLFCRKAEGMLLIHRCDIVETVEIRDRLLIGLVLDQLFGTAMQEPDMRIDAIDHLAVKFQHEAQHAMRRRMLRPEVDGKIADGRLGHAPAFPEPLAAFSSPGRG